MIGFISWQAPLTGESMPQPGVMYWFPPLSPSLFSGPGAEDIVAALRAGGCPARSVENVGHQTAKGSAVLLPTMAALETAGWRFSTFRGEGSRRAAGAAREAVAIAAKFHNIPEGLARWAAQSWILSLITRLGPLIVPFNLETYLQYHFTKVGNQTTLALEAWIQAGEDHDLPTTGLRALYDRILECRTPDP